MRARLRMSRFRWSDAGDGGAGRSHFPWTSSRSDLHGLSWCECCRFTARTQFNEGQMVMERRSFAGILRVITEGISRPKECIAVQCLRWGAHSPVRNRLLRLQHISGALVTARPGNHY
jgi:hypothetical protein